MSFIPIFIHQVVNIVLALGSLHKPTLVRMGRHKIALASMFKTVGQRQKFRDEASCRKTRGFHSHYVFPVEGRECRGGKQDRQDVQGDDDQ